MMSSNILLLYDRTFDLGCHTAFHGHCPSNRKVTHGRESAPPPASPDSEKPRLFRVNYFMLANELRSLMYKNKK